MTNFQQAWSGHLGKAVSSDVVCFNSRKILFSDDQMMCRSSQDLVLSIDGLCESKSLCTGVWQQKGLLAIFDSEVEESSNGGVYLFQ